MGNMKKSDFKIGEKYLCNCGECAPFTIVDIHKDGWIEGLDETSGDVAYSPSDYAKLRPYTKLDKILK